LKGVALLALAAIALLRATSAGHAEDAKGPSEVQQDGPLSADTMREPGTTTTGHVEIDSNITRPRTQDDVIREILSSQPSDKSRNSATIASRVPGFFR
jgi:hypothetical protein